MPLLVGMHWPDADACRAEVALHQGRLEAAVASPRTVGTHVSHMLAKLGVRSRVELAAQVASRAQPR